MKELFKLSAVLTIICCCASLAIAYTYSITKEPIAYQHQLEKLRAINWVLPGYGSAGLGRVDIPGEKSKEHERRVYVMTDNTTTVGAALEVTASGYGGPMQIMIGILPDATVSGIDIMQHQETPGLGANITRPEFYRQFAGKTIAATAWDLKKNKGDFDQVTGATISSKAVMHAVHDSLLFVAEHKDTVFGKRHEAAKGSLWDF